jgi:hypothetical protein
VASQLNSWSWHGDGCRRLSNWIISTPLTHAKLCH